MANSTVFIILGATCTGKTSLAVDLCQRYTGEIISADSRQVYKYMDIGTGKFPVGLGVSPKEARIWGYDLVTPKEYFSVYDYAFLALPKMRNLLEEGKNVFVVGGTGLYVDVITRRVELSEAKPDFELRKILEMMPVEKLLSQATSLNPEVSLNESERRNKNRLIRLIEKSHQKNFPTPLPYLSDVRFIFLGLTAEREILYSRVDAWLEHIWKNGLLDEVKNLQSLGFDNSPKLHGLVYKSAVDFLEGRLTEKEAVQRAKFDLHAYVRRQQTYFKKNRDIQWFDISRDSFRQSIYNEVEKFL